MGQDGVATQPDPRAVCRLAEYFGVATGFPGPRRLCDATRNLAARALAGEFGRQIQPAGFGVDGSDSQPAGPDILHARAVQAIARHAPLRLVPGERLVGSATLLEAAQHKVPVLGTHSVSHTTVGFEKVLTSGYKALRRQIEERLARSDLDAAGRELLQAMRICLDAASHWHSRHVALLEETIGRSTSQEARHWREVLDALRNVPENPPATFREALQSLWMMWSFLRLCGNWSGLGRIDKMLGPYLQADLQAGRITLEEARELLAHFWIKGCEWITAQGRGSGDAQFYQNVILGGIDEQGHSVVNDVTYLVLEIVEELHISDFPIAVRVGPGTPQRLWEQMAAVQRQGGGIVSIYNEELVIRALVKFGYPLEEARNFTNDGCWEVLIPGKTAFSYHPFDMLQLLQESIGLTPDSKQTPATSTPANSAGVAPKPGTCSSVNPPSIDTADGQGAFPDFESLYEHFRRHMAEHVNTKVAIGGYGGKGARYAPLVSLFVEDCIERARGYHHFGPKYSVLAPHAGGLPDTANSLLVLKDLVYDEKRLPLGELLEILRADWKGHEDLRREVRQRFVLYGNGNPEADTMVRRLFDDFTAAAARQPNREGVLRPAGISTFGREIEWRHARAATAFGSIRGDILATNLAPTPGTDRQGPTAVIRSYCSMNFEKLPNGVPLELKLLPSTLRGPDGIRALVGLMKTFLDLGGWYLQIDVVDSETLRDAQRHPDRYPNLAVRISGWSARFTTLDEQWQEMIIQRTQHAV